MSSLRPASSSNTTSIYALSDDDEHRGRSWAREVDTDPWNSMILALDGGGIRGYSSLLIMQALMHQVADWERQLASPEEAAANSFAEETLLPCHYFDYMYGTSTGGLIGTMLGRLRMTVPQCLELYRRVGDNLFGKRRSVLPLATKYHHEPLERAVREIVMEHCKQHSDPAAPCDGDDWFPWAFAVPDIAAARELGVDFDRNICQTVCLTSAHNERIDEAYLLRTYDHQYHQVPTWISVYNEGADKLKIWEVTRATSAAPFYFATLEADIRSETGRSRRRLRFKDGGIRENNPSGAAWSENQSLNGGSADPALLLSIGTGRPNESNDGFADAWPGPLGKSSVVKKMADKMAVFRNLLVKYTDGEKTHKEMLKQARGENSWYKRLNVDVGLQAMPLDDWRKGTWTDPQTGLTGKVRGGASLSHMERVTKAYLERTKEDSGNSYDSPGVMLQQTAEKLVRVRRARMATRATDPVRWDTFMGRYLTGRLVQQDDGPLQKEVVTRTVDGGEQPALGGLCCT